MQPLAGPVVPLVLRAAHRRRGLGHRRHAGVPHADPLERWRGLRRALARGARGGRKLGHGELDLLLHNH